MPESGAAVHAHRLVDHWDEKLEVLATALDERAHRLRAAADAYDTGERRTSEDFDQSFAPRPGLRTKRVPGW